MGEERFGPVTIYRPPNDVCEDVIGRAGAYLREEYNVGVIYDAQSINGGLQRLFQFYEAVLNRSVSSIASRDTIEFVLHQYDRATAIKNAYQSQYLGPDESARWNKLGPVFRRAAKYLGETLCLNATCDPPAISNETKLRRLARCWLACEEMVKLSIVSTQTFAVWPAQSRLIIHPSSNPLYAELELNPDLHDDLRHFEARQEAETDLRERYLDDRSLIFNDARMSECFDAVFESEFGFCFSDAFTLFKDLAIGAMPAAGSPPIPFVNQKLFTTVIERELAVQPNTAETVLAGVALRPQKMKREGRVLWKPKQEHRALKRPFFEFPHESGTHLAWSKEMAIESLMLFWSDLVFRCLPDEWSTDSTRKAVASYGQAANSEFESAVLRVMRSLGMHAARFKKSIGQGEHAVAIPKDVGEIDCVGYSQKDKLLFIADCKMVRYTVEPATFRDDLDKFVEKPKSYAAQIRRKHAWLRANVNPIVESLATERDFPNEVDVTATSPLIITYFPTIASLLLDDISCRSITELAEDYKLRGKWPYRVEVL